jgi:hypothetical protein
MILRYFAQLTAFAFSVLRCFTGRRQVMDMMRRRHHAVLRDQHWGCSNLSRETCCPRAPSLNLAHDASCNGPVRGQRTHGMRCRQAMGFFQRQDNGDTRLGHRMRGGGAHSPPRGWALTHAVRCCRVVQPWPLNIAMHTSTPSTCPGAGVRPRFHKIDALDG